MHSLPPTQHPASDLLLLLVYLRSNVSLPLQSIPSPTGTCHYIPGDTKSIISWIFFVILLYLCYTFFATLRLDRRAHIRVLFNRGYLPGGLLLWDRSRFLSLRFSWILAPSSAMPAKGSASGSASSERAIASLASCSTSFCYLSADDHFRDLYLMK
jgi:hypothetical protein